MQQLQNELCRQLALLPTPGPVLTVEGFYATQTEQDLRHDIATTHADWLMLLAHPRRYRDQLLHRSFGDAHSDHSRPVGHLPRRRFLFS